MRRNAVKEPRPPRNHEMDVIRAMVGQEFQSILPAVGTSSSHCDDDASDSNRHELVPSGRVRPEADASSLHSHVYIRTSALFLATDVSAAIDTDVVSLRR